MPINRRLQRRLPRHQLLAMITGGTMLPLLALGLAFGLAAALACMWWSGQVSTPTLRRHVRLLSLVGLVCGLALAMIILART